MVPTFITIYSTDIELGFNSFAAPMDSNIRARFEEITTDFLTSTKKEIEGLKITITSVAITTQNKINGIRDGVRNNRFLLSDENKGLAIDLTVSGTVQGQYGLQDQFSFGDTVLNGFHHNFTVYKSLVERDSEIHGSIMQPSLEDSPSVTTNESDRLALYVFIGCSVAGGALVVFLAFLFVKIKRDRNRFELPTNLTFQDENEFIQIQGLSPRSPQQMSPQYGSHGVHGMSDVDLQSQDHNNISNRSGFTFSAGQGTNEEFQNSAQAFNESFRTFSSRPVSRSDWQGSFAEPVYPTPYTEDDRTRRHNLHSINNTNSQSDSSHMLTFSDSDQESLGLNVAPEAILEAQRTTQQYYYVPQGVPQGFPKGEGKNNPLESVDSGSLDDSYPSVDCISFEHDCPPGPLGIVIDTSTKGPLVHSIKPDSKMKGVLLPGDIIIGLDGTDTRAMTAPTLTSLMANKSLQDFRTIKVLRLQ